MMVVPAESLAYDQPQGSIPLSSSSLDMRVGKSVIQDCFGMTVMILLCQKPEPGTMTIPRLLPVSCRLFSHHFQHGKFSAKQSGSQPHCTSTLDSWLPGRWLHSLV